MEVIVQSEINVEWTHCADLRCTSVSVHACSSHLVGLVCESVILCRVSHILVSLTRDDYELSAW